MEAVAAAAVEAVELHRKLWKPELCSCGGRGAASLHRSCGGCGAAPQKVPRLGLNKTETQAVTVARGSVAEAMRDTYDGDIAAVEAAESARTSLVAQLLKKGRPTPAAPSSTRVAPPAAPSGTPHSASMCRNPRCSYLAEEAAEFQGYCCKKCNEWQQYRRGIPSTHGKFCRMREPMPGALP